jgi:hypothetical protein
MKKQSSAFIRSKTVKGKVYWYLVSAVRVAGKPRQKVIGYLGDKRPESVEDARRIIEYRTAGVYEPKKVKNTNKFDEMLLSVSGQEFIRVHAEGFKMGGVIGGLVVCNRLINRLKWRWKNASETCRNLNREAYLKMIKDLSAARKKQLDSEKQCFYLHDWQSAAAFDPRVLPDPGR